MFVLNGIVYASEKRNDIEVISAKPLDDMMMILTFSTGEQRLFDATILTGSAFLPLKDDNIFKNCKVIDGAVTWMDEEIDCAPEFMYENSFDGNVMQEGTIAEITITTADGRKYETNLKLTANDLQLFDDVRQLMK